MKDYDLKADVEAQFPAVWRKVMSENNATPQSKPQGILLGGSPEQVNLMAQRKSKSDYKIMY